MSNNKFESLLELLINEENDKAEALFHEIVVEKSRDIYEGLAEETTKEDDKKEEVKETEASDEKKDDEVKETESTETKDDEVKETESKETKEDEVKTDEGVFSQPVQKTDEESIEEIGGDATDALIKDISSDEEGEGDNAADELGQDMDADAENGENGEEQDVEDRVVDLEDALDELKAEFAAMMGNKDGEDDEAEEMAIAPVVPAQETQPEISRFEGKDDAKEATKETVKEYAIKKSADNADKADNKSSPVKTGGAKQGGTPVKTGSGAEDKGRPAPTAQKVSGDFANTGGKNSLKTKEVKAKTADGSDKSGKSPISGK
jgi:hypothetical protein